MIIGIIICCVIFICCLWWGIAEFFFRKDLEKIIITLTEDNSKLSGRLELFRKEWVEKNESNDFVSTLKDKKEFS